MRAYTSKEIARKPVAKPPTSSVASATPTNGLRSSGEVDMVDEDDCEASFAFQPCLDPSIENDKNSQDAEPTSPLENARIASTVSERTPSTELHSIDGSPTIASLLSRSHSKKPSLSGIMRLVKLPTAELASLGRSMAHKSANWSISSQSTIESFELEISWMQMVNSLRNMYGTYSMVNRFSQC